MLMAMLMAELGFKVSASAENGAEALALLDSGLEVDLVLSDLKMPVMDGIQLTTAITARYPLVKVVILTMHAKSAFLERAIQAGARGFLLKDGEIGDITDAIRRVDGGELVFGVVGR